jgi:hypothetical protein
MRDDQYTVKHYEYPVPGATVATDEKLAADREKTRRYRAANAERLRANAKANQEEIRAKARAAYASRPYDKEKRAKQRLARREANPEKERQYSRNYRARNPELVKARGRALQYKGKFDLSLSDVAAILSAQGGTCACCGSQTPGSKQGWHVDHCHKTGAVRGILCSRCNRNLGYLGDQADAVVESCARFLRYLTSTAAKTAATIAELKSKPPPESHP